VKAPVRLFFRLAAVVLTVGLLQALLETLAIAILYRDLLFAPDRFFTLQIYDAFTKLYFLAAARVPLPGLLDSFLAQGFLAKAHVLPALTAINAAVSVLVAALLTPLAPLFGLRVGLPRGRFTVRAVVATLVVIAGVHIAIWLASVKLPLDPTLRSVMQNLGRDAVRDGVIVAAGVGLAASVAALALARNSVAQATVAAVALLAAAAALALDGPREAAAAPAAQISGSAPARGYNVVLISIDSLRADHLGTYGYRRATSPAIDRLGSGGAVFTQCRSTTSWTLPAHMSLLTGRSLLGHGVVGDDRRLGPGVPTLAQAFHGAGYATGAVVSAPYVHSRFGFAAGFDDYDDTSISFATNEDSYKTVTAPQLNAAAEKWLTAHAGRPFFLFLHYWDVHYDYAPGPPYDTMFDPDYRGEVSGDNFYFNPRVNARMSPRDLEHVLALYDGEIRLVDDHVAKLRAVLERLGIAGKTIVVLTADHGDEFFEHGNKGHHRTLYDEVLHVPLVMYVPGTSMSGARVAAEASIVDVMPTLLGLTGIAPPEGLEGADFTRVLFEGAAAPERPVFSELYRKGSLNVQVAAVAAAHKVIHHFNARRMETYDLAADAAEHERLANDRGPGAAIAAGMRDWLDERWHELEGREERYGVETLEMDAKTAETLRSLGYLQ
jgi:arylsulfatase A-like enzyme